VSTFQIVSAFVCLGGSRENVVHKGTDAAVTYPEILVLQALHGGAEFVHTVVVEGTIERDMGEEFLRLQHTYGEIVEKVFPSLAGMHVLPQGDPALASREEVDAAAQAGAAAANAVRKRNAKAAVPQHVPAPETAKAPDEDEDEDDEIDSTRGDGLPSLDSLPS
jgi:hypothetical protein